MVECLRGGKVFHGPAHVPASKEQQDAEEAESSRCEITTVRDEVSIGECVKDTPVQLVGVGR